MSTWNPSSFLAKLKKTSFFFLFTNNQASSILFLHLLKASFGFLSHLHDNWNNHFQDKKSANVYANQLSFSRIWAEARGGLGTHFHAQKRQVEKREEPRGGSHVQRLRESWCHPFGDVCFQRSGIWTYRCVSLIPPPASATLAWAHRNDKTMTQSVYQARKSGFYSFQMPPPQLLSPGAQTGRRNNMPPINSYQSPLLPTSPCQQVQSQRANHRQPLQVRGKIWWFHTFAFEHMSCLFHFPIPSSGPGPAQPSRVEM